VERVEVEMTTLAQSLRIGTPAETGRNLRPWQRLFVYGSLTPIMLLLMFFAVLPMVWAVVLCFFDYSPVRAGSGFMGLGGANPFVGLDNFTGMLADNAVASVFRLAFWNTIVFAVLVLPLNLAITLPLAVMIESVHDRLKGFFRGVYFLPVVSSSVAVAIMWTYIYHPQQGLLNMLIRSVGVTPPRAWLTDPRAVYFGVPLAMIAVIIAYVWQDFGYNMVIFIAALQGIPGEIRDAARVDGANAWQQFWSITVPLLRPTILFVCVMTMLSSLQVFVPFQVMTMGGPAHQTEVLVKNIYDYAFRYHQMGWASAVAMVLFVLTILFTVVEFRLLRSDVEY
jgi:multiple sugar transport system permease protein/raffinose/stachyose/melibiose transport system permease protein